MKSCYAFSVAVLFFLAVLHTFVIFFAGGSIIANGLGWALVGFLYLIGAKFGAIEKHYE